MSARKKTNQSTLATQEVVSVIHKEKGQYCVKSPNNSDWSGGCYDSKGEAEKRLKQVEWFKHNKESSEIEDFRECVLALRVAHRYSQS